MSEITSASTIVQTLNAGSGIDIKNLAQSLADAENAAVKGPDQQQNRRKNARRSQGTRLPTIACLN